MLKSVRYRKNCVSFSSAVSFYETFSLQQIFGNCPVIGMIQQILLKLTNTECHESLLGQVTYENLFGSSSYFIYRKMDECVCGGVVNRSSAAF